MSSIRFSARKPFIALAAISAMAVLAYYYFGLLVPGKGSELNSRGFRILARLEQNIHEKKVNIRKTIELFGGKEQKGTELVDGLYEDNDPRIASKKPFIPLYDDSRNRWTLRFHTLADGTYRNYRYNISRFFDEILGFRKDFFEEYVILHHDSIIYQTRALAYTGDTESILAKRDKRRLYSDFVAKDTLAGKQYYTFYHPFDRSSDVRFVLCGLVSAEKYNRDKYLLNTDQVIWISLLFLLAAFSLPFIKVFTVSRFERLQHYDIIRMGAALVAGASIASVAMLLSTYSTGEEYRQRQAVKELNDTIRARIVAETGQILREISTHERNIGAKNSNYDAWIKENIAAGENVSSAGVGQYFNREGNEHHTEVLLLINSKGWSWGGWLNRHARNSKAPLHEREYVKVFADSLDDHFPYVFEQKATREKYFIQPIYSWLDQQNMVMASKEMAPEAEAYVDSVHPHIDRDSVNLIALETRLFSLMNTALPDEMNFCILDENGNVLFHSDDKRNLRENFIEECSKASFLREAVTGRMDTTLTVHYYGHNHYACLAPLKGLPYTVVTLYDTSFFLEALTNQVTFSISMLVLLGLLILFVFLTSHFLTRRLTLLKRQKINLRWLRFNPVNIGGFIRLMLYLLVPSALSLVFFRHTHLLFISFILPVFTLAMAGAAIFITHARAYKKSLYAARIIAQFRVYFGICAVAALTLFAMLLYTYEWQIGFELWVIGALINITILVLLISPKLIADLDNRIVTRAIPVLQRLEIRRRKAWLVVQLAQRGAWRKRAMERFAVMRKLAAASGLQTGAGERLYLVVLPMMMLLYNLSVFPARNFFLTSVRMERELLQKRNSLAIAGKIHAREKWLATRFNGITAAKEKKGDFNMLVSGIYTTSYAPSNLVLYADADQVEAPLQNVIVKQHSLMHGNVFLRADLCSSLADLYRRLLATGDGSKVATPAAAVLKKTGSYTLMPATSLEQKDRSVPLSANFTKLYMRVINLPNITYDAYELKGIFMHRDSSANDPGTWYWDNNKKSVKYAFPPNETRHGLHGVSVHTPLLKNTWQWLGTGYQIVYVVLSLVIAFVIYAVLQFIYRKIVLLEYFPVENSLEARREADKQYILNNAFNGATNLLVISLPGTDVIEVIRKAIVAHHYKIADTKDDLSELGIDNIVFASANRLPGEIILVPFFDLQAATGKDTRPLEALSKYFQEDKTKVVWVTSSDPCEQVSILTGKAIELYKRRATNKDQALDEIYAMEQEQENMLKVLDDFEKVYYALEENKHQPDYTLKYVEDEFRFGAYFRKLRVNIMQKQTIMKAYFKERAGAWSNKYDHADERFVLKIQDIAQSYYFSIWSGLSSKEKYVLYDFAQDELTNYKNYFVLADLESKGILYFCDHEKTLKIFNKSFRNFILTVVDPEEALLLEKQVNISGTWEIVRMVLIIFFVSIGMFLFFTEHTIFNKIVGVTTALTSLAPAIINFFANLKGPVK